MKKTYKIIAQGCYTEPFASIAKRIDGRKDDAHERGFIYLDGYGLNHPNDDEVFDFNGFEPDISWNILILSSEEEKWQKFIADYENAEKEDFIIENNPLWDYGIHI